MIWSISSVVVAVAIDLTALSKVKNQCLHSWPMTKGHNVTHKLFSRRQLKIISTYITWTHGEEPTVWKIMKLNSN